MYEDLCLPYLFGGYVYVGDVSVFTHDWDVYDDIYGRDVASNNADTAQSKA